MEPVQGPVSSKYVPLSKQELESEVQRVSKYTTPHEDIKGRVEEEKPWSPKWSSNWSSGSGRDWHKEYFNLRVKLMQHRKSDGFCKCTHVLHHSSLFHSFY